MEWTPEAEAYLKKVPLFVRKKVKKGSRKVSSGKEEEENYP
ncbi:MAG: hypothetical protein ACO2OY_08555 [Thermodesulfobacteriaceae bacterium]|jgi:hypothetical protein